MASGIKKSPDQLLVIYRATLARYVAAGSPMAAIQRDMITDLERRAKKGKAHGK